MSKSGVLVVSQFVVKHNTTALFFASFAPLREATWRERRK